METIAFRKYSATYIEATKTCAGTTKFAFIQSKFFSFSLRSVLPGATREENYQKVILATADFFFPAILKPLQLQTALALHDILQ
jgi:hypothetical protein